MKETNKSVVIVHNFPYLDILNKERPISKHPKLSMEQRAAQFAPFQALTGYKEQIIETSRDTTKKKILTEEEKNIINDKLNILNLHKNYSVKIKYFKSDDKKEGGKYLETSSKLKKIDAYNEIIHLENNIKISLEDILNIEINNYEDY